MSNTITRFTSQLYERGPSKSVNLLYSLLCFLLLFCFFYQYKQYKHYKRVLEVQEQLQALPTSSKQVPKKLEELFLPPLSSQDLALYELHSNLFTPLPPPVVFSISLSEYIKEETLSSDVNTQVLQLSLTPPLTLSGQQLDSLLQQLSGPLLWKGVDCGIKKLSIKKLEEQHLGPFYTVHINLINPRGFNS